MPDPESLVCVSPGLRAPRTQAPRCRASDAPTLPAAAYQSGLSSEPLRQLDERLAQAGTDPQARRELEAALIVMLQPDATFEARLFACQRLAIVGSDRSLPALEPLLRSPDTVGMACLALANFPSAKADAALRNALPLPRSLSRWCTWWPLSVTAATPGRCRCSSASSTTFRPPSRPGRHARPRPRCQPRRTPHPGCAPQGPDPQSPVFWTRLAARGRGIGGGPRFQGRPPTLRNSSTPPIPITSAPAPWTPC
jgi:hypothetical protein